MTADNKKPEMLEALAALEHDQWAHWTRYFLDNMTPENVERWRRQCETPYALLTEQEKDSDRVWARKVLALVNETNKEMEPPSPAADLAPAGQRDTYPFTWIEYVEGVNFTKAETNTPGIEFYDIFISVRIPVAIFERLASINGVLGFVRIYDPIENDLIITTAAFASHPSIGVDERAAGVTTLLLQARSSKINVHRVQDAVRRQPPVPVRFSLTRDVP